MKILVIEDDRLTAQAISAMLSNHRYAVEIANDGQAGWDLIESFEYDLILLDVSLPRLDGVTLCGRIRKKGLQIPIMLLTGRDSSHEKAIGLDAGADDYMVKPFEEEELVARVRALLRRSELSAQPVLSWGELNLDPSRCQVTYCSELLPLTPKEYALLELFLRNRKRVFSCGMILEHLWAFEEMPGEEAIRTHIKGLRQKLKKAGAPQDLIETVYGIGYRLRPIETLPEEILQKQNNSGKQNLRSNAQDNQQKETQVLLNNIWYQSKDQVKERIEVLENATASLFNEKPDRELCKRAQKEAHTLAGTLGTFGFFEATELARNIEKKLGSENVSDIENRVDLNTLILTLRQKIDQPPQHENLASYPKETEHLSLLIIDSKTSYIDELLKQSENFGFTSQVASTLNNARSKILCSQPNIILFNPLDFCPFDESLGFLAELNKQVPPISVVLFTDEDLLQKHPEFSLLGRQIILKKDKPVSEVLDTLVEIWKRADQTRSKIVVVDDDDALLAVLSSLLRPWGIQVITLNNSRQCLEILESSAPDLLVLDIEMPEMNGIELCQQIRDNSRWDDLPILFLTVHNNADIVNQVFNLGAIDYINKPIIGPEFIVRIINYLERIRLVKQMMTKCQIHLPSEQEDANKTNLPALSHPPQNDSFTMIEKKLSFQLNQESAVVKLALAALDGKNFAELMKDACLDIVQNMDLEFCGIFELLPVKNALLLKTGQGWREGLVGVALVNQDDSLMGLALQSNEPILVEKFLTEDGCDQFTDSSLLQVHGIKSCLMVSIDLSGEFYGVLGAYSVKQKSFSQEEIKFLKITANILSRALEQQRMKESLYLIQTNLECQFQERMAELVATNQRLNEEIQSLKNPR
jgi:DNA-binding response OmpR family regulator/HPt (histidine-containing phosphotransfer) domain-containing protein